MLTVTPTTSASEASRVPAHPGGNREVRDGRPLPLVDVRTLGASSWRARYGQRLMVTDAVALAWAGAGVHLVFLAQHPGAHVGRMPFLALTVAVIVTWFGALSLGGTRLPLVVGHGPAEYKRVAQVSLVVFGSIAILSYLFDLRLPRSFLLVMAPGGLGALLISRYIWRRWLHVRRDFGQYQSTVLAVGSIHTVTELIRELRRSPRAGYRVIGACITDLPDGTRSKLLDGIPILGAMAQVKDSVRRAGVDIVAITASPEIGPAVVRDLSWDLEDLDVGMVLAPGLTDIAGPRIHTQPVNGLPLIHVDKPTYRGANRALKKTFDIVVACLILAVLLVPLLVIAVIVKMTSRGPVLFRQERVGLNGETFRMTKFRSMIVDAEARLSELLAERNAGNDVMFKMANDPRVTRIGRVLRRYSLDELPQLLNVLGGKMSLVGPRPPLVSEVAKYGVDARRRLLVKPGMTGLWQVSGRSNLDWAETVRLDSYYVENWSITGDLVILWKTAQAVVSGGGAF